MMDSHGWRILYPTIRQAASTLPPPRRRPRYSDVLIVAMLFWTVLHDRPMSWACDRGHYSGPFRPRRVPSVSQFSRRLRCERTRQILAEAHRLSGIDLYRDWGQYLYPERIRVEQGLAHMATFGGGLGPLPLWVRSLERVRRWVGVKVTLYHLRRMLRKQEMPQVA